MIVAVACGLASGAVTALAWNALLARFGDATFRPALSAFVRQLAAGASDAELFRQYLELVKRLASYVGRNLAVLVLAFLPLSLFIMAAAPPASRFWNKGADSIVVYCSQPLSASLGADTFPVESPLSAIPTPEGPSVSLDLATSEASAHLDSAERNWAFSSSGFQRLLLEMLGFDLLSFEKGPALVIVRPSRGDGNPLWPWVNDLEFAFLGSLTGASLLVMLAGRLRASRS
jgi:hypothetical protein